MHTFEVSHGSAGLGCSKPLYHGSELGVTPAVEVAAAAPAVAARRDETELALISLVDVQQVAQRLSDNATSFKTF